MKKFTRFIVYVKPCLGYIAAGVFFGLIFGLSSGFGMPTIIREVLPKIFSQQGSENEYSLWSIVGIAMLIPGIFLLRAISGFLSGYFMTYASLEILRRIKQELFDKIQNYPVAFFDKFTTGDVLVRLTGDTAAVQNVLLNFSSEIFRQPLQVVGALGYLIYQSIENGNIAFLFVFIAAVPFCILPVQIIRKRLKEHSRSAQIQTSGMAQIINENLDAAHEVRVFGLQKQQSEKFSSANVLIKKLGLKIAKYELFQQPSLEFLAAVMVSVTFVYAYFSHIDFSTFAAIGIALYFTVDPIKRVVRMCSDLMKTTPMFERLGEILDWKSTVPDPENPVAIGKVKGDVEFDGVSFSYNEKIVLSDVSIKIPAGTSCALVGESGAGKSTFAKLAMRLYDPVCGDVKIDGVSLRDISGRDYAANIGSVPQYPVLFNDTIFNNILLARPDATADEVYEAAKNACADDFIKELEGGYETMAGERGDRLSGGQKQRIAIARVFLKNPPLIFLDEATSALDANSESAIQKAIDKLMKGRTMFIIAHRFSTIRNVEKIIVFKDGNILDFGSHDELMQRCQYYRKLYERQMSK